MKHIYRWVGFACLMLIAISAAAAEDFVDFVNGRAGVTSPYGASNYIPITEAGFTRKVAASTYQPQDRPSIGWPAGLDPNKNIIATIDQASTVKSIVGTVDTPVGAAATVSVYKAGTGVACPGGGTVLHTGSFNANGTANGNQTLAVSVTALSAGDRLCLGTTGGTNWTGGVGIGGLTVRITTP